MLELGNSSSEPQERDLLRRSPFSRQFKLLLNRFYTKSSRNPIAYIALVFMGIMQGLFQASIFGGAGAEDYT